MEQNPSSAPDLRTMLATTIMAPVIDIMLSGKFTPGSTTPIGKEETVVGELTVFEKSLSTAMDDIINRHNDWVEGAKEKTMDELLIESKNRKIYESLESLFHASIVNRVGTFADEGKILEFREGYKIVILPPRKKQFGGIIPGMPTYRGIGSPDIDADMADFFSHNCSECDPEKYERCNLPFKAVRP